LIPVGGREMIPVGRRELGESWYGVVISALDI